MKNKAGGFLGAYMRFFIGAEAVGCLKMTLFLALIFTAASIFAVINSVNEANRKAFLKNCDFDTVELVDCCDENAAPCYRASALSDEGDLVSFNMFTSEQVPFFCEKNRMKGNFSGAPGTAWLTYEAAHSLNARVGSVFRITVKNENEGGTADMGEYCVDGILLPFCGDLESNTYDDDCGFACIFPEDTSAESSISGMNGVSLKFGNAGENSDGDPMDKYCLFDQSRLNADYTGKAVGYIFPVFSLCIAVILVLLECMHYFGRREKRFAIFSALGLRQRTINGINALILSLCSLGASAVSVFLHRFIMAELIGKYVPWRISIICSAAGAAVSIAVVLIYISIQRRDRITRVLFSEK